MVKASMLSCSRRIMGKASLRLVRKAGQIPGIIYGQGKPGTRVVFDGRMLERLFITRGPGGLFSLQVEDDPGQVLAVIREIQRDPVNRHITHVDFLRVDADEKMDAAVAVHLSGEEALLEKGGFLQVGAREIQVRCLPQDLPESINLDVSLLIPGDQVVAASLLLPVDVELISEASTVIATVIVAHSHEEPEPEPAGEEV